MPVNTDPTINVNLSGLSKRPLTLAQAADFLQVSKRTVEKLIDARQLPAFKVGARWRVWSDDLESHGRSRQVPIANATQDTRDRNPLQA